MSDTLFIDAATYPTIQDAINAAINAAPGPVSVMLPDGPTFLTAEIQIPPLAQSRPLSIIGRRHRGIDQNKGTTLIANAPMRSAIAILSANHRLQDVRIDANRQAQYGLYLQNTYASQFDNVLVMHAIVDGWFFTSANSNNDASVMTNCWSQSCGTTFATAAIAGQYAGLYSPVQTIAGTASVSAGNTTITVAGGSDLTALGARAGDFVRVGDPAATAFFGVIDSVTASTIVLQATALPQTSGSGLPFAVFVGFGVNLSEAVDNNILVVVGGQYRGSSGSNFNVKGLFGSTIIGASFTYGHVAGCSISRDQHDPIGRGTTLQNCYFEANQAAEIWADRYTDLTILSPVFESVRPPYKIRPEGLTPIPAQGLLLSNGLRTLLPSGTEQNFVFELRNNDGTLEHRFVSDSATGGTPVGASQINGASPTFSATPVISPTTGFTAGAGIQDNFVVFDTDAQPPAQYFRPPSAVVEIDSTSDGVHASVTPLSADAGGVTIVRLAIALFDDKGDPLELTAQKIGKDDRIVVRFAGGYIR